MNQYSVRVYTERHISLTVRVEAATPEQAEQAGIAAFDARYPWQNHLVPNVSVTQA